MSSLRLLCRYPVEPGHVAEERSGTATNTELAARISTPFIRFDMVRPSGKHILEFEHVTKSYGDERVIHDFGAAVMRGEKYADGRNGLGKRPVEVAAVKMDQAEPISRSMGTSSGARSQIGYFPQDHNGSIEKGITFLTGCISSIHA